VNEVADEVAAGDQREAVAHNGRLLAEPTAALQFPVPASMCGISL